MLCGICDNCNLAMNSLATGGAHTGLVVQHRAKPFWKHPSKPHTMTSLLFALQRLCPNHEGVHKTSAGATECPHCGLVPAVAALPATQWWQARGVSQKWQPGQGLLLPQGGSRLQTYQGGWLQNCWSTTAPVQHKWSHCLAHTGCTWGREACKCNLSHNSSLCMLATLVHKNLHQVTV